MNKQLYKIVNGVKTFFSIIGELITEAVQALLFTILNNLYVIAVLIEVSIPYLMWDLVISLHNERGYFAVGGEVFIPIALLFVSAIFKKFANRSGKGYEVPVANKRFTKEEEFGEVTISEGDLQEIILYLNDVENYIEKKGIKKW